MMPLHRLRQQDDVER